MIIDATFEEQSELQADFGIIKKMGGIDVDNELSLSSENPVQNKVVTARIEDFYDEFDTHKRKYEGTVDAFDDVLQNHAQLFQSIAESKQDKLTFDEIPTKNSTNPVTSGGLFNKFNEVYARIDDAITECKEYADELAYNGGGSGGGTTPTQKKWEKIVDYTVKEGDTSPYLFTFDGFSLTDFQGKVVYQNGGAGTTVKFAIDIRTGTNVNNRTLGYTTIKNFSNSKKTWKFEYIYLGENQGGLFVAPTDFVSGVGVYPNTNVPDNIVMYIPANALNESDYHYNSFSAIVINPSVALSVGDTIEIWGVKK